MTWIIELSSSPAFNFAFSFATYAFIPIIGVIVILKVIKEGFRR